MSLFPWLCLGVSCQKAEEQSQTFILCARARLGFCPPEKGERESECVSILLTGSLSFCVCVCPHACSHAEEGKPYLLEQHPCINPHPPPHPTSSLSHTSSLNLNRDRERLAAPLHASDLQASRFLQSPPQTWEPMSSH